MVICKGCDTPSCDFVCKRLICEVLRNRFLNLVYCIKHSDEKIHRDNAVKEIEQIFNELNFFECIEQKKE